MTSTDIPSKKLKLLCMHGWGTNKDFMKMQTEILRRDLDSMTEFIFVDGPFELPLEMVGDPKVTKNLKGKAYAWHDSK